MRRWLAAGAVLLVGFGVAGWVCRADLKARYYTHKLLTAADGDVAAWVAQADGWGDRVPERLLDCLTGQDATACNRAGAALARLQSPVVAGLLAERFSRLSTAGQQAAIECATALVCSQQAEAIAACRQIVRSALQHADAAVRLNGAALALRPEIGQAELLAPLLKDPSSEVRRMAIAAVGPSRSLIADDDLLNWLHDPDADVRRMTDAALRGRGLRAADVRLGRLLTDPRPTARLDLLVQLSSDTEINLSVWLKRLSEDPSPAVRAATVRLIHERQVFQLTDRLAIMSTSDPEMTVRQTAVFYFGKLQPSVRTVGSP
jgi:hypothetical protein